MSPTLSPELASTNKNLLDGLEASHAALAAISTGRDFCPYPGLRAFFTHERDWYFGREHHVDAMLSRLESNRFLAVVGSSGSGKSSLVFAGLMPALDEGQLAGGRRDGKGDPAPWRTVSFHPGNDPLAELATAILEAAPAREDRHLPGCVRAALDSGERGLVEALKVAGLVDEQTEVLVYADQFEELFRFGEKSGRAAQEKALRFARLFVVAAEQVEVRMHVLLSMRSEFIGECERFPGLSELVSASQFLTPRLSRRQLEQSLSGPAEARGWSIAPDALTAIINDCGNSPDQLPLAQHVLRRMWIRVAGKSPNESSSVVAEEARGPELTLEDYRAVGGIQNSIAQHGDEILANLPQPDGAEVARIIFMALCEQREDGPLVRRLSNYEEVSALVGEKSPLVPRVLKAFGGDDPGFIREDKGWLDVRHEAILRQWPLIGRWLIREEESEAWLRRLSQAAKNYQRSPENTELWRGKDLAGAEEWIAEEAPAEPWAQRHSVRNWSKGQEFLERSRVAETARLKELEETARQVREEKERRQKRRQRNIGILAGVAIIIGFFMTFLWQMARDNAKRATENAKQAERNETLAKVVIKSYASTADVLAAPIVAAGKSALSTAEQQSAELLSAITKAGIEEAPNQSAVEKLVNSRRNAESAADAIDQLVKSLDEAALITEEPRLKEKAESLTGDAVDTRVRRAALHGNRNAKTVIHDSLQTRVGAMEKALGNLLGANAPDPNAFKEKEKEVLRATAVLAATRSILKTAEAFGFKEEDFPEAIREIAAIEATLNSAREIKQQTTPEKRIAEWEQSAARVVSHSGKINRFRFSPQRDGLVFAAAACEDGTVALWTRDWTSAGQFMAKEAFNDIAFSPRGDALAAGGNGSSVRIFRPEDLKSQRVIKGTTFERHSDSITDVEFSHGGQQIASASADRTVRVFSYDSMAQRYFTSPPLPGIVTAIAFHPGDNLVVSACDDSYVRLHTIDQPAVQPLGHFESPARRPEFSADGNLVVACSGDKTARVFSILPAGEVMKLDHPAPVTQATFRPKSNAADYVFISTATNGEVRMVRGGGNANVPSRNEVLEPSHSGPAVAAKWSADGHWLATVGGGEVLLWEWSDESLVARLRCKNLPPATSRADFSPDGHLLATYGGDNNALIWNLQTIGQR